MWNIIAKKQSQKNICCVVLRQFPEPLVGNLVFSGVRPDKCTTKIQHGFLVDRSQRPTWNFYPMEFCCGQNWANFHQPKKLHFSMLQAFGFCKSLPLDRAGGGVSFGWECWPNYVPMASSAQRFQTMSLNLQPFHFQGVARYILATKCHAGRLLPTKKTPGVRPAAVPPL